MSKQISAAEHPLSDIFSSKFEYNIPPYQRPYAWKEEQVSELFDDLYRFYTEEPDEGYFLGSIVLIKEETIPKADVIDGQQRLTTLTMLFACLAYHVGVNMTNGEHLEYQRDVKGYILEPGKETQGIEPKPRLNIREKDVDFFEKYVHELDFNTLLEIKPEQLKSEPQKLIQSNIGYFIKKIKEVLYQNSEQLNIEELKKFIVFLTTRCFLVVVSTPNKKSASRIFSVMNSRGLDLQATDIIKAEVIHNLDSNNQLNQSWEDMENSLGREDFNNLFTYIRMIYAKEKPRKELQEEFRKHVLISIDNNADTLIKNILEPYCDALSTIRGCDYPENLELGGVAESINNHLRWLGRIENSDWIPPAMQFLSKYKNDPEYILYFFKKLERLSAYLYICSKNINERIKRYAELIKELEESNEEKNPLQALELTPEEKDEINIALSSDIYSLSAQKRNYIIHRLDDFMSGEIIPYNTRSLTIEHVLPQTPKDDSEWSKNWTEKQRNEWVHKLANLVLLNRRKNSQAKNYDFNDKKSIYFEGKKGLPPYPLTITACNETQWTPEVVKERQGELLDVLKENWELD